MRDRREDAGQYYPGGRVVTKTPTGQGGGGTSDYDQLANKPKINNHELTGNKTAAQLGLATPSDIPDVTGKLPLRTLPPYLHYLAFDDTYPADAAWLYAQPGPSDMGRCSAVRRGGKLWRNYDWTFDDAAEFVVMMSGNATRFASVGVASVGSRLTENDVMSAVNSRYYKCLPGMTLDGINEKGVVCEINVDGGPKTGWHGDANDDGIHILAAVRWALDHGETAAQAAAWIADHIIQPQGEMNFHFMVADATSTYIVENGAAHDVTDGTKVLTNYALYDEAHEGGGKERYQLLADGSPITDAWFTNAYQDGNNWHSDFASESEHAAAIQQWAYQGDTKEAHRGKTTTGGYPWWQSVHTTEYDFAAKTMKVAVQEVDDWYTFALENNGTDEAKVREIAEEVVADSITDDFTQGGKAADAKATGTALAEKRDKADRAVYSVIRTENTDWVWTSENKELLERLNNAGTTLRYYESVHSWIAEPFTEGYWAAPGYGDRDLLSCELMFYASDTGESSYATATRPRYMDETLGPAKQNQQLAAVATDNAAKPADGSLMKYDAANDRFVKAVEGTDYLKTHQDISGKFDATHDFDGEAASLSWEAFYLAVRAPYGLFILRGGMMADEYDQHGQYVRLHSLFQKADRATTLSGYGITDAPNKSDIIDPALAAAVGKIADAKLTRDFVNLMVSTNSAHYLTARAGTAGAYTYPPFASAAALRAALAAHTEQNPQFFYAGEAFTPTKNDWVIVSEDEDHPLGTITPASRYGFVGTFGSGGSFQYQVSYKLPLTTAQIAALDSGATATLFEQIAAAIADRYTKAETDAAIAARLPYETNSAATLKDRAVNQLGALTTSYTLTIPTAAATGKPRDFLLRYSASAAVEFQYSGITLYGDLPSTTESGDFLVAITEVGTNQFYCRKIKLEAAQ